MKSTIKILTLSLLLAVQVFAEAIGGSITGKVVNAATKEPVPFANVVVVGAEKGAATGIDGTFLIEGLAPGTYQIRVSSVGFITLTKTDIVVTNARPFSVEINLVEASIEVQGATITSDYFYRSPTEINSVRTFGYEEIRRSPGGFEDVVRALSVLPGVGQVGAGRNDLVVRGGAPSENLFIVDGIEVPNINHFGTQGASGGPQSFINLDFVRETSFSTGAFPVLYGDKLSSVLSIDLREGRNDKFGGKATIAATQFGLNLEGPLSEKANFIFSARRSFLDFIFKAAGFGFVPEYYDLLTKINYDIDKSTQLNYIFVGAYGNVKFFNDTEDQRFSNSRVLGTDQLNYVTGLTYRKLFNKGYYRLSVSRVFTNFDSQQRDSLLNPIFLNKSFEAENKIKADMVYQISKESEFNVGIEAKDIKANYDIKIPSFRTSFGETLPINALNTGDKRFVKAAVFANWTHILLMNRVSVNAGVRLDYFTAIDNQYSFSPRFGFGYRISDLTNVSASIGRYYQAPSLIWLAPGGSNTSLNSIQADQLVVGVDHRLQDDLQIKLEAYYKDYSRYPASFLRPYLSLANTGVGFNGADDNFSSFGLEPLGSLSKGNSRGVEFSAQKKLSTIPLYGIMSFTFNETRFTSIDGVERFGSYDQRIIFNISGGYQFSPEWEMSTRFRYATGALYTPYNSDGSQSVSNYLTKRLPDLHSLDVRIDRRWFFSSTTLIVYLDLQNIYNKNNISQIRWDQREKKEDRDSSIGILPSIGVSLEF